MRWVAAPTGKNKGGGAGIVGRRVFIFLTELKQTEKKSNTAGWTEWGGGGGNKLEEKGPRERIIPNSRNDRAGRGNKPKRPGILGPSALEAGSLSGDHPAGRLKGDKDRHMFDHLDRLQKAWRPLRGRTLLLRGIKQSPWGDATGGTLRLIVLGKIFRKTNQTEEKNIQVLVAERRYDAKGDAGGREGEKVSRVKEAERGQKTCRIMQKKKRRRAMKKNRATGGLR